MREVIRKGPSSGKVKCYQVDENNVKDRAKEDEASEREGEKKKTEKR